MTDASPYWPEDVDVVTVTHAAEVEDADSSVLGASPLGVDPEDYAYLGVMSVVGELRKKNNVILMLSDGVTSHCVVASRCQIDGRRLTLEVMDPAWRSSFLRAGMNVAGVAAEEVGREGFFRLSDHELARVYQSGMIVTKSEDKDEGDVP